MPILLAGEEDVRHEAASVKQVQVLSGELSIRPGSYRHGGKGDRPVEAGEKGGCLRQSAIQRAVT